MHIAHLLTGGNSGNRERYLAQARSKISEECGELMAASAIFETAAWGNETQRSFYNQALEIKTSLPPEALLAQVLSIEQGMGRIRKEKYGARTIDIDILFFEHQIISLPQLTVPHPQLHLRRFALQCLNDIAPDLLHPQLRRNVRQLLADCTDPLEVLQLPA
ncbi:MAG: 2-amino-4-hydroxy-6-hydroxymethyldihydropteridine diphosphokinase [Chitinophagaceae bacterium]